VIATLVEMKGDVVFQNAASMQYWGALDGSVRHQSTRVSLGSFVSKGVAQVLHIWLL